MDLLILSALLIAIFLIVGSTVKKWQDSVKLKEDLLERGVELEAEVELIKTWGADESFIIEVRFQRNGQSVKRRKTVSNLIWTFLQKTDYKRGDRPKSGDIKKCPVLVDPLNPQRFLFNTYKYQLKKRSEDSVKNFLDKNKAEHQWDPPEDVGQRGEEQ